VSSRDTAGQEKSFNQVEHFDVAIVGGGVAGNMLARQLMLTQPELRVGVFERETETSYKVGEASVEIAANYFTRRLGLTTYLYENQLPKNGLRYFFDSKAHDTPLEHMSEVGSVNLPFHPAFQLDRSALEADLLEMNVQAGVRVERGAKVSALCLGEGGAPHRFTVNDEQGERRVEARWLVDAGGRGGLVARLRGLREPVPEHEMGSVWGRFENVVDIDAIGREAFRARVRHTSRRLSTNHFMYSGYWIWFIPLRGGMTSVGATGARFAEDRELRTPEGFRAFLESHAAVRELLAGAKLVDIGSYRKIAYGTKQLFDADRWALVGEAATSADPLYSPGGDFIAIENDMVSDLIARDFAGETPDALGERAALYDEFVRFRHRATVLLYAGLYDTLGSFELSRLKWTFDLGCYYNLWVHAYLRDEHLDLEALQRQMKLAPLILGLLDNFAKLFQKCDKELRGRGDYYRGNTGRFLYGLEDIDFAEEIGNERSEAELMATTLKVFNVVRAQALELLGKTDDYRSVEEVGLSAFLPGHELP
jgi:flavin-dependent dehydrogenase